MIKQGKRFSGESGFSLIETLVGIVVLSTIGIAMVAGIFTLIKSDETVRTHVAAESLARYELEYVKAMVYLNAPWEYEVPGTPPSWDLAHNSLPSGYDDYSVIVNADTISGCDADIQKVSAIINYKGNQVLQIDTYLTK